MGRLRALPLMMSLLLLGGCGGSGEVSGEDLALEIQKEFAGMTACSCQVALTADYETRVFDYVLDVTYDVTGGARLTIVEPEIARGVTAAIQAGQTQLVYDGFSLDAGPLTGDGLSPLEAVPTLYRAVAQGYIAGIDLAGETLSVTYRDGENEPGTGLEAVVRFDAKSHAPISGELYYDGARIIQAQVKDFQSMTPQAGETPAG